MAAAGDDVKLLGTWASPFVVRARIALAIKQIDYENVEEDMFSKSDLLLQSNPVHKKVPVLIHRGRPVSESLIILHYIDEAWPAAPKLLPSDPHDRAVARFWASFLDEKWAPPLRRVLIPQGGDQQELMKEACEATSLLENAFPKGQRFFGGEAIGFLDIAFGSFLPWMQVLHTITGVELIDQTNTPNLFRWAQDFSAVAAVKEISPEHDKLLEYANRIFAMLEAPTVNR